MEKELIKFNHEDYLCRWIDDKDGKMQLIAPLSLMRKILAAFELEGTKLYKEAYNVDEEIYFYTADENLKLSDKELRKVLHEECGELF